MEPIRNEGDIGANRQYFEGILASCFEDAKDQFPLDENGKLNVLSVGCGNGFDAGAVLMYFPNSVYKGIDIVSGKDLPQNSYVDLIDTKYFVDKLSQRPDLKIIVTSLPALSSIKMVLPQHKIYLIPQHHCNFERVRRTRKELTTIGFIGSPRNFQLDSEDFSKRCSGLGLKFMYKIDYKNRGHVCNFLQQIDVQLDWRPKSEANNPLKIINAASFGVPTIAFPKDGYQEIDGYYFKAENSDEIFEIISNLKRNGDEYTRHTQVGMIMAEEYHIQKIAKFYLALN